MRSLLPLRSLTMKLGLVLFGLVFVVIAMLLLLVVVPRLESRLVDARIDRIERGGALGRERDSPDLADAQIVRERARRARQRGTTLASSS